MERVPDYIEMVKQQCPELQIKEVKPIETGQNNDILVINSEYIFRFPKYPQGIEDLLVETEVLKRLKNYITLQIPNPQYSAFENKEVGSVFVGYKLIKGESLWRDTFLKIRDKQRLAYELATFLQELHSKDVRSEVSQVARVRDIYAEWLNLYQRIEEKLFIYMSKERKEEVENNFTQLLDNLRNQQTEFTVVHGDFGPSNILYDEQTGSISGIIDFGSVHVGDPALDFAAMIGPFGYGEEFLNLCAEVYPKVLDYIERAKFYASTFALQEALFGIENNDQEAFQRGMGCTN